MLKHTFHPFPVGVGVVLIAYILWDSNPQLFVGDILMHFTFSECIENMLMYKSSCSSNILRERIPSATYQRISPCYVSAHSLSRIYQSDSGINILTPAPILIVTRL